MDGSYPDALGGTMHIHYEYHTRRKDLNLPLNFGRPNLYKDL